MELYIFFLGVVFIFVVSWIYLRKRKRSLVVTLAPLVRYENDHGFQDSLDSYNQQKLNVLLRMWQTGNYLKIIIVSQDYQMGQDEDSFIFSVSGLFHKALLENGVASRFIEQYSDDGSFLPSYISLGDTVVIKELDDYGDPSLPAFSIGDSFAEEDSDEKFEPSLAAVDD